MHETHFIFKNQEMFTRHIKQLKHARVFKFRLEKKNFMGFLYLKKKYSSDRKIEEREAPLRASVARYLPLLAVVEGKF